MSMDMSQDMTTTLTSLKANHFDARFIPTATEARALMLEMIPLTARVGVGHSATLEQIGILADLIRRGTEVINPFDKELIKAIEKDPNKMTFHNQTLRESLGTDVYLASSNAVTEDGRIVNIDRVGNRVAGIIFGAPKVILPIGRNKIVKNVDEAINHIKNVITPVHAGWMGRRTPCAVTGKCNECDSPDRMCNITLIIEKQPLNTQITIILINEDLGLGWNPTWDVGRINQIRVKYTQNV